ncbi:hypothetical protein EDE04_1586 [Streptomyces sp. 2132.2]|uniref:hypothetical protein n=1 Tax=Streptomyces sp. 2132.2 TaxID=2485161 RepID=UPI000F492D18|nr:hypothetical protein [Streptomyces sp. 2132.2]ROQ95146.1 hypothetical protein EDE04_1586 [Streptomyces sp. 2132.2]
MKLHTTIHTARLGAAEFKVIRPARTPVRALLVDDPWYVNGWFDQEAARTIAGLWALAATSPRSLVHLPLRANAASAGEPQDTGVRRPLDLVLLHHSLQFAPSRWKELRGRLGPGRPRTVDLPCPGPDAQTYAAGRHHREDRDRFRQDVHSETLFMTGSARTFREAAGEFADLARTGPGRVFNHGGRHCCRSVDCRPADRDLHLVYREEWPA